MAPARLSTLLALALLALTHGSVAGQAAGLAEDLTQFRAEFFARDHSYAPENRRQAEARLTQLEERLGQGEMTPLAFELALSRVAALADNGHTFTFPGPRSVRYNRILLRFVPFGNQFYVLRAPASQADLLGGRLLAIDGHPMAAARDSGRTIVGGTPAWRDRWVPFLLESPEQLHAFHLTEEPSAATYRLALPDGKTVERRLEVQGPDPEREGNGSSRWLFPDGLPGDAGSWRSLLDPARAPWSLQDAGAPFRWRRLADLDLLVIDLRQNRDAPSQPIQAFLDEVSGELQARPTAHVVLDLRMNGGGDLNTTRDFLQRLPALVSGRIFILTSPWTFSAAISSTGYLKQAGGNRVTIVGEMVGDRLEFWAEGSPVRLKNTGALFLYASERHDYRNGCRTYPDCHGPVARNPISVPTLTPDIPAPWTVEAYRAGRDPAMEAVVAALKGG